MSAMHEVERRLRAARPLAEGSPPPLRALLARIEQTAATDEVEVPRRRRRRRTVIPLALAAILLLGAGGGALLLMPGRALPPAFVLPENPDSGLGLPIQASAALLPLRVADPGGGPPWGMRVIRTTRGLVCLQAGRVVGGQLGGLGTGHAFNADGRFHPFLPADAIGVDACPTGDQNALAFLPNGPVIVTADGLPLAGENVWPADRVHCDLPGEQNWGVRCPQAELRQVAVGLLGPDATSIDVSAPGQELTVKPYGREGAYLVVLPAQPDANAAMGSGSWEGHGYVSSAPGGAVLTVTYTDGSRCQIPADGAQRHCQRKGFGAGGAALPSSAQVSAAVVVRYRSLVREATPPLLVEDRNGGHFRGRSRTGPNLLGEEEPGPALALSFEARQGARSESSGYFVEVKPREVAGCATPATIVSQPTQQTVSPSQRVEMTVPLESSCATSYAGRVFFAKSSSDSEPGVSHGQDEGPLYEVVGSQFGGGPHSLRFPTVGRFQISAPGARR